MNDQEKKHYQKTVTGYIDKWIKPLGLLWWKIDVRFSLEAKQDEQKNPIVAITEASWPYKRAAVTFYLPNFDYVAEAGIENIVVHELCHILVNEMQTDQMDIQHEERVVTTLADAFLWTYEKAQKEAVKSMKTTRRKR